MKPAELLGWSGTGFHVLCIVVLVVAVAVYGKRVGGLGPWLVGLVGIFDLVLTLAYTIVLMTMRGAHLSFRTMDSVYDALRLVDVLLTLLSAGLLVLGFAMMRKRPATS